MRDVDRTVGSKVDSLDNQTTSSGLRRNTIQNAWQEIRDLLPYITEDPFASRIEVLCNRIARLTPDENYRLSVERVLRILHAVQPSLSEETASITHTDSKTQELPTPNSTETFYVGVLPQVSYQDIAGLTEAKIAVREMVELPLCHPELFQHLKIEPPKGVMLYGPPGCGKTQLARAAANESDANFLVVNGPECYDKFYGQTEAKIREVFTKAQANSPSIIFFDEFDALAVSRDGTGGKLENRVVSTLLSMMDGLVPLKGVSVLAATNRLDLIDSALLRWGRFDRLIEVPLPNLESRVEILKLYTTGIHLDQDVDLDSIARETAGFSGAQLKGFCNEAAWRAIRRIDPFEFQGRIPLEVLRGIITMPDDFDKAIETTRKGMVGAVDASNTKTSRLLRQVHHQLSTHQNLKVD